MEGRVSFGVFGEYVIKLVSWFVELCVFDVFLCLVLFLGCKIKVLWVKMNIYIKIFVCGEDFVFVVMGRKEDVVFVKWEIILVVEYFF